jgi:hypothetical protein
MAKKFLIFGITKDSGYSDDPDAAINKYHYWRTDFSGGWVKRWDWRQNLVDKVKSGGVIAYSYPNGRHGALCTVKVSPNWVEYLKTIPNSNPEDNLSNLPEYD